MRVTLLPILLLAVFWSPLGQTHTLGEGYLFVEVTDESLNGWFEITLSDLDKALDIDSDQDGRVEEQDVAQNIARIQDYLTDRVDISDGSREYQLTYTGFELLKIPVGQYMVLRFESDATQVPDVLTFRYDVLFDEDSTHRGFLVVHSNTKSKLVNTGEDVSLIFGPDSKTKDFDFKNTSPWSSFVDFLKHGVWHIWIGIDHILFLVALLLPSVLQRKSDASWIPTDNFKSASWAVVKIVTLFTLAHTITLTLAALDIITLPSRLVESVIAASVVIAALNNLIPIFRDNMGWVVFGFGLFHGFGFASVLQHLTNNATNLVADLAGFNIGVEIGQIAIVAVVFPILYALRSSRLYIKRIMPALSIVIGLLAAGWLVERSFDLAFLPI
ncbi:MAG: HupE/UreJ family protein [Pseudomonadota bacterium]